MDKLGVSARKGLGVVMRQTYYGLYYPLTDKNNLPNPVGTRQVYTKSKMVYIWNASKNWVFLILQDYWLSYLHKQLAGEVVLNVTTTDTAVKDTTLYWESFWKIIERESTPPEVRVYAHCSKPRYVFEGMLVVGGNSSMKVLLK